MSEHSPPLGKRLVAEFLGTFMLVFIGTFSVTTNLTVVAVGLAFAAAAIGAIYSFGHLSGAHINPAVSVSLAARGKFPWREVVPYAVAQIVGAIVASLLNASIIGVSRSRSTYLGRTYPGFGYGAVPALILEIVMTFILVLTILSVTEKEASTGFAGLAIGLVLGFNIMLMAGVSGGSMNPARSFGPVLVSTLLGVSPTVAFDLHWIYWLAPLIGGLLATLAHWLKTRD